MQRELRMGQNQSLSRTNKARGRSCKDVQISHKQEVSTLCHRVPVAIKFGILPLGDARRGDQLRDNDIVLLDRVILQKITRPLVIESLTFTVIGLGLVSILPALEANRLARPEPRAESQLQLEASAGCKCA